jgi:hypothetical protein
MVGLGFEQKKKRKIKKKAPKWYRFGVWSKQYFLFLMHIALQLLLFHGFWPNFDNTFLSPTNASYKYQIIHHFLSLHVYYMLN